MKYLVKSLVAATALTVASSANAFVDNLCPYLGVDYYQAWMKGKGGFNRFFPKSYPGATLYIGSKFCENFGFEVGYNWSGHKKRSFTVANGTTFFGTTITGGSFTGNAKVRRQGGFIDLLGFLPVDDCFEVFGSIGWGWLHPKVTFNGVVMSNGGTLSTQALAFNSFSSKGRSVLRLGIGARYMVTDCVGLRAKLGWETSSSAHFRNNNTAFTFGNRGFRDSATLSLGAFVNF